jgi:hypothetical protein
MYVNNIRYITYILYILSYCIIYSYNCKYDLSYCIIYSYNCKYDLDILSWNIIRVNYIYIISFVYLYDSFNI